jgi:hypothetical protein
MMKEKEEEAQAGQSEVDEDITVIEEGVALVFQRLRLRKREPGDVHSWPIVN